MARDTEHHHALSRLCDTNGKFISKRQMTNTRHALFIHRDERILLLVLKMGASEFLFYLGRPNKLFYLWKCRCRDCCGKTMTSVLSPALERRARRRDNAAALPDSTAKREKAGQVVRPQRKTKCARSWGEKQVCRTRRYYETCCCRDWRKFESAASPKGLQWMLFQQSMMDMTSIDQNPADGKEKKTFQHGRNAKPSGYLQTTSARSLLKCNFLRLQVNMFYIFTFLDASGNCRPSDADEQHLA